ncbi:MAG TPA: hypothetical protein VLX92_03295, partial [Kofleriaceae bacterium]|nr:hypothetical protein [Kofleriaceae bacterium]
MSATTLAMLSIALVACDSGRSPAPPPPAPPPPPPAVLHDAAPIDARSDAMIDAPIDAPVARTSDDDFKAMVRAYAKRRRLQLASWGTLHLDGSKKPYRYA